MEETNTLQPPTAAKLRIVREMASFLEDGYGGLDLALDSVEWCGLLNHDAELYVALEVWARNAFPEFAFDLMADGRSNDPNFTSCAWHLSIRVK